MCSSSEAGSYLRLIDFVYHSTLGLRVIKKKKRKQFQELWWACRRTVLRMECSGCMVLGFRVEGLGLRVWGQGLRVKSLGCRV